MTLYYLKISKLRISYQIQIIMLHENESGGIKAFTLNGSL